jgi:hypothetical protein
MLRPLADVAYALNPFGWLLADAEFDSERNHRHVREKIGALSAIPAKRGGASWEVRRLPSPDARRVPTQDVSTQSAGRERLFGSEA